ncbi:hypothetical protein [Bacillus cytotoxicus]|uniref:hypothetical protein n=1 Tax=Bacillus cytotoxicus TaxID=580165 RepID=UPI00244A092B|nr:hypothetical protein [Bacillus cytotoxicus]MDH2888985.1 hypothetical protein [Bacillus cytotoxicus]
MNFDNMKYMLDGKYRKLEEWMRFSLHLGQYVKRYADKKKETFNLYISLPNSLSFSYFLLYGIVDAQMEQAVSDEIIIQRFKQLKAGDVVYYLDGETWKRCSVEEEVVENLTSKGSWHLKILNHGGVSDYIPLSKWETHVMIANRKFENIMNARVVKDIQRITGNIKRIYSPEHITRREVLNIPAAYVIGNRTEFKRYIDEITYFYIDTVFTPSTVLRDGTKTNFCNIQWISKSDINTFDADNHEWVVFIGASKALARMSEFSNTGRIILDDQFENWDTSALLRENIEQEILVSGAEIITSKLVDDLYKEKIDIPKGVEILAWK